MTQVSFDGFPVELYDGRFQGRFEIDDEVGARIQYDDVVTFVVTATAHRVEVAATKDGDLKRTNTFVIDGVKVLTTAEIIAEAEGYPVHGNQQSFEPTDESESEEVIPEFDDFVDVKPSNDKALSSFLSEGAI